MTRLYRAHCLTYDDDVTAAVAVMVEAVAPLTDQQCQGIILFFAAAHGKIRCTCSPSTCGASSTVWGPPSVPSRPLNRGETAHAHSARLYTRNAGDFLGVDTLVEIVPV